MSATHGHSAPPGGSLASIVYCSRATNRLTPSDLQGLLQTAQARNRAEEITGLVLYDDNRFYQWLEGPADGVARIMDSIHRDPRHTDLRIIDDKPISNRFFADWDMKLATPDAVAGAWVRDAIAAPNEITEDLRLHPDAAPSLLVKLVPLPIAAAQPDQTARPTPPHRDKVAALLRDLMLAAVIPRLAESHGVSTPSVIAIPGIDPRVPELVKLLLLADEAAAMAYLRTLESETESLNLLYSSLMEPAARSLGDMWSDDLCSDFDVTLGLCRMQTAVRLMGINVALPPQSAVVKPAVLITPEPGELHQLTAALDSDVLERAGWSPTRAFPHDDTTLQDMLSQTWFDALDLSLSTAMNREHYLPRVAQTIQLARRASQNPALVVLVGGRTFVERGETGQGVGADATIATSRQVGRAILDVLKQVKPIVRH